MLVSTFAAGAAEPADLPLARAMLTFDASSGAVRVKYLLPSDVTTLRFDGGGRIRNASWSVRDPAATIDDDGQTIALARPSRTIDVDLHPVAAGPLLVRTYAPLVLFDEQRAAAVYAENLMLDRKTYRTVIEAIPGSAIADGVRRMGSEPIWDSTRPATYLLLGSIVLTTFPTYSLVVDPRLPRWIADLGGAFDRLLALYEMLYSPGTRPKPVILMTYGDPFAGGATRSGDALPGFVRLDFSGREWAEETRARRSEVLHFIAHELFHLWNGHLFHASPGRDDLWLIEGGADAAADEAVWRIGETTDSEFLALQNDALAICTATAGATFKVKSRSDNRSPYRCGAAIFNLAAWSAESVGGALSAGQLWRRLFDAAARREERRYGAYDFLQAVSRPIDARDGERLDAISGLLDREADWTATLRGHAMLFGIRERAGIDDSAVLAPLLTERLVLAIMSTDCKSLYGFSKEGAVLRLDANASCDRFAQPSRLTAIDGHRFDTVNLEIYRDAQRACESPAGVAFTTEDRQILRIVCGRPISGPPVLFEHRPDRR